MIAARPVSAGAVGLLGLLLGLAACARRPAACEIAAASSLRPLLTAVLAELAPGDPPAALVTGSSTQLDAQVRHGAPFALLLAADSETVDGLVDDGHAASADAFEFARGRLVLWTRHDHSAALASGGLAALRELEGRIAVAAPQLAPYGRAAIAALRNSDVLTAVEERLVYGENAAQAAHFASAGAADAALLPRSLCISGPLAATGSRWPVPAALHEPIRHRGVVLADDGRARELAVSIRAFLRSPRGAELLIRHGFEVPD